MKKLLILAAMLVPLVMSSTVEAKSRHRHHHNQIVATQSQPVNYTQSESAMDFMIKERAQQPEVAPVRVGKKTVIVVKKTAHVVYQTSYGLAAKAERYVGASARQLGLPRNLWCADFMNMITHSGSDRRAVSYLYRGRPAPYGCTDCVAITHRRGGGHVGVVKNYDRRGNPILVSGNHGHRVGEGVYSKRAVIAYRYI